MRDLPGLPRGSILGYCTNVHAGATLEEIKQNLERFAVPAKRAVSPTHPMGIGLWFQAEIASELAAVEIQILRFREWLGEQALLPYTINGFPYGNFHAPSVKQQVYSPNWGTPERAEYTFHLAVILQTLLPENMEGSISTLPVAWHADKCDDWQWYLASIATLLSEFCADTRSMIHIDLEPEPGCAIQRARDVVNTFDALVDNGNESNVRHFLRVCHDICHAAVMFEDQREMFVRYREAGIKIGKVQISNAIRVPFDEYSESERREALQQLSAFAEDRYLHQTMIRFDDGVMQFFEDLPLAIRSVASNQTARGEWRIHFHVPVYLEQFGLLKTTRDHIIECMQLLKDSDVHHWEVETYAWNVLPAELKVDDLADGIARELLWVKEHAAKIA